MTTVITYGTFDLFHQGHYNILKRAKALGDYLIVGVTGESYDIERGKLNVKDSLPDRINNVLETGFADKIIIEEYLGQKINDVIKYNVDILVVGSDWIGKFDYLNEYCKVVYLERTKGISSTQIRSERGHLYRIGIVTEDASDGSVVSEARYVSGAHVESVYSKDIETANECAEKYELEGAFDDYKKFLESVDMVYIRSGLDERTKQCKIALEKGKHVICEPPVSLSRNDAQTLYSLAEENKVLFTENIIVPYLRAFTQLIWILQGGIIGRIGRIEIKARCGNVDARPDQDFWRKITTAVHIALKVMVSHDDCKISSTDMENLEYKRKIISLFAQNRYASIEISNSPYWENGIGIYGSEGAAYIPDDWWNMGFFEIKTNSSDATKRYSFNFEGTGMRYLLQEALIVMETGKSSSGRFTQLDSCNIIRVLNHVIKTDK